ncbi:MAG: DnaJ domain-containing protein [Acidobacteria bacterium]|nr:DnaJ domain-containing protein [Acidobacteriota bacterium]
MQDDPLDYYEVLQISPNADQDMIQRVYRLLAQRLHPDNQETGNAEKFRHVTTAHTVLSNPEERARYDVKYNQHRQERWRLVASGPTEDNDYDAERRLRLTILEILYTRRRMEPSDPGVSNSELIQLLGKPREHLEFTFWYLAQRKFVIRNDQSDLTITADGVDHLEQGQAQTLAQRRLREANA